MLQALLQTSTASQNSIPSLKMAFAKDITTSVKGSTEDRCNRQERKPNKTNKQKTTHKEKSLQSRVVLIKELKQTLHSLILKIYILLGQKNGC